MGRVRPAAPPSTGCLAAGKRLHGVQDPCTARPTPPGGPWRARGSDEVGQALPARGGGARRQNCSGTRPSRRARQGVVVLERGDLRGVAPDGPALALLVGHVRDDGGGRPRVGSAAAWPRARPAGRADACSRGPRSRTRRRSAARLDAPGDRRRAPSRGRDCPAPWGRTPKSGRCSRDGGAEDRRHLGRRRAVRRARGTGGRRSRAIVGGLEDRHGRDVLLPPHRHHVVARPRSRPAASHSEGTSG